MSEILRYTTAEAPRDIVNDEGDVLPYSSEAAESARDLQGALELQDQQYLEQDLTELQFKGHDIRGAFVPEVAKDQGASTVPNSEHAAEEARDAKIEHLMDTMGISYEEAEKRVE